MANKCIDCKHHMYSDMYLECSKAIPGTYPNYNDGCDEWEAEKCCCNCLHCARWRKSTGIETHCDLDDRYLGYLEVMDTDRECKNWEKETKWEDGDVK